MRGTHRRPSANLTTVSPSYLLPRLAHAPAHVHPNFFSQCARGCEISVGRKRPSGLIPTAGANRVPAGRFCTMVAAMLQDLSIAEARLTADAPSGTSQRDHNDDTHIRPQIPANRSVYPKTISRDPRTYPRGPALKPRMSPAFKPQTESYISQPEPPGTPRHRRLRGFVFHPNSKDPLIYPVGGPLVWYGARRVPSLTLPKPASTDSACDLRWQEELGIGQGLLEGLSPAGGDR